VANHLFERMQALAPESLAARPTSAEALAAVIEERRQHGEPPLRLASVYPFATHNYQLRYWLSAAGIDPDTDVCLRVVPPPLVASHLEAGWIDGYCVGEPWNSVAVAKGLGRTLITSYELWNNGQEKALGVRSDWAEQNPETHQALLRALLRACDWLDQPTHRNEAAHMLSDGGFIEASPGVVARGLTGRLDDRADTGAMRLPDSVVFHRYAANFPWRSQTLWYASQMARWGHLPEATDLATAVEQCVRPDLYRRAAADLGLPAPARDRKREGEHSAGWQLTTADTAITMGADCFFDGHTFDPERIGDYLAHLPVSGAHARVG